MKNSYLPSNLKYLIKSRGLLVEDFANIMGWKRQTVSSYNSGAITPPLDKAARIAKYFGVLLHDLVHTDLTKEKASITDNPRQANPEILDMLKRYERLLQELEQDKSVTEDDYRRLWETVREHAPELAKRIEGEFKH